MAFAEIQKANVSTSETFDFDARVEFSDAIALASNMELLTLKASDRNQTILKVGSRILNDDNRQLQANLFLIWYYFRKQKTILPQIEISQLLDSTRTLIASIDRIVALGKVLKKSN